MKINKIYDDVIKTWNKGDRILLGEYGGDVVVSPDALVSYLIPEKDFILDKDKLRRGAEPFNFKYIFDHMPDTERIFKTGDQKVITIKNRQKTTIVKIGDKWVDEKLLKNFNEPEFFSDDKRNSMIFICEFSKLVGLVCPFNHDEESDR